MGFEAAKLPTLSSLDTGKLQTCSSEDLRRLCTSLAAEKYHAPVRIDVIQRSSFTEAQVVSEQAPYARVAGDAPQLKALSTSVRSALESLWRKLKRVE